MSDVEFELQKAVYAALDGDSALGAIVTGVFDDVPHSQVYPFVEIGDPITTDYEVKELTSDEHTIEIHVWSEYRGNKEVTDIFARLKAVLHDQSLAVTGSTLVNLLRQGDTILRDVDPRIRHGIMTFRAVTQTP